MAEEWNDFLCNVRFDEVASGTTPGSIQSSRNVSPTRSHGLSMPQLYGDMTRVESFYSDASGGSLEDRAPVFSSPEGERKEREGDELFRKKEYSRAGSMYEASFHSFRDSDSANALPDSLRVLGKLASAARARGDLVAAKNYLKRLLDLHSAVDSSVEQVTWAIQQFDVVIAELVQSLRARGDEETAHAYEEDAIHVHQALQRVDTVHSGWMHKQGKIRKNWKRRYFRLLSNRELRYYTGFEAGLKCKGIIDLNYLTSLVVTSDPSPWAYGLTLQVHDRTWQLRMDDEAEFETWYQHISLDHHLAS